MIKGNRVDIYTRLSDEDRNKKNRDDDSDSIVNQKSMLLKYALNQGWEVINVYSDDDLSGAGTYRPGFEKLISDCENGLVDIVLCKTQSRFTRDMEMVEKYINNKFKEWNIRFVSIVDNADTNVQGNKKSRQINGLVNEWYLEDLSDNIRSSLQTRREDGLYLGSFAPYGYQKDPMNKNKLIVDPVAAEVVKKIFAWYVSGVGYYTIASNLHKEGILTPVNYKKNNGSKYVCSTAKKYEDEAVWCQDTISRILRNEVYIGNLVQGIKTYISYKNHKAIKKPEEEWTRVENTHEAIIDLETWNTVQNKLKKRVRAGKRTGEVYMLSQKIICKECGSIFTRNLYHTKSGPAEYMKCKSVARANRFCDNKNAIRCDLLEKIILDEINKQLDLYYNYDKLSNLYELKGKELNKDLSNKIKVLKDEKEDLMVKIEKKNNYYKQIYEDKLEGIITKEEFTVLRDKFINEIDNYKERQEKIDEELLKINEKNNTLNKSNDLLKKYKHIDVLTREIVNEFLDHVEIGILNKETGDRKVDVYLNIIKLDQSPC